MRLLAVQNCELEGAGRYARFLNAENVTCDVHAAYRGGTFPRVTEYDAFLIGGTPISVYHADAHPFMKNELDFLRRVVESGKPCLGVCCGAQMLATVLGARVFRNPVMEIGVTEIQRTVAGRADAMLDGFPDSFTAFQWHGDTFDIPPSALHLARSADCANQMFRLHNVVGLLFHFEVSPLDAARWVEAYAQELAHLGKTAAAIVEACDRHDTAMADLGRRLMGNFVKLAATLG